MNGLVQAIALISQLAAKLERFMPTDYGRVAVDLRIGAASRSLIAQVSFREAIEIAVPQVVLDTIRADIQRQVNQATDPERYLVAINFKFVPVPTISKPPATVVVERPDLHLAA